MHIHFSELPPLAQSIDLYWQSIATAKPPTLCFDLDDCSVDDIDKGLGVVHTWQNSEEHRNLRAHLHYIALQKLLSTIERDDARESLAPGSTPSISPERTPQSAALSTFGGGGRSRSSSRASASSLQAYDAEHFPSAMSFFSKISHHIVGYPHFLLAMRSLEAYEYRVFLDVLKYKNKFFNNYLPTEDYWVDVFDKLTLQKRSAMLSLYYAAGNAAGFSKERVDLFLHALGDDWSLTHAFLIGNRRILLGNFDFSHVQLLLLRARASGHFAVQQLIGFFKGFFRDMLGEAEVSVFVGLMTLEERLLFMHEMAPEYVLSPGHRPILCPLPYVAYCGWFLKGLTPDEQKTLLAGIPNIDVLLDSFSLITMSKFLKSLHPSIADECVQKRCAPLVRDIQSIHDVHAILPCLSHDYAVDFLDKIDFSLPKDSVLSIGCLDEHGISAHFDRMIQSRQGAKWLLAKIECFDDLLTVVNQSGLIPERIVKKIATRFQHLFETPAQYLNFFGQIRPEQQHQFVSAFLNNKPDIFNILVVSNVVGPHVIWTSQSLDLILKSLSKELLLTLYHSPLPDIFMYANQRQLKQLVAERGFLGMTDIGSEEQSVRAFFLYQRLMLLRDDCAEQLKDAQSSCCSCFFSGNIRSLKDRLTDIDVVINCMIGQQVINSVSELDLLIAKFVPCSEIHRLIEQLKDNFIVHTLVEDFVLD